MQKANLEKSDLFYKFNDVSSNITAIFTNRKLNVGFLNQPESQIKNNRSAVLSELNLNLDQIVCARQAHTDNVYIAKTEDKGRGACSIDEAIINMDAFITGEKGVALSIFVADCLPVFIIDKDKGVIALAHAGWRGTKSSIVKKTIFMMQQVFKSNPKDLIALLGPAMRRCCYEVEPEFLEYFKRGVYKQNGKLYFDNIELNCLQLKETGVLDSNIFDCGFCTHCQNDEFFSYRKEKESCGRQMALIVKN